MKSVNKNTIVFISYYRFKRGNMQQVLENVFSKEIANDCKVIFLLYGDLKNGNIQKWNNAEVWITELNSNGGIRGAIQKILSSLKKYCQIVKIFNNEKTIIFVVRDQPWCAVILGFLKNIFKYKLYLQYSAPLGLMGISYFKKHKSIKRYFYLVSGFMHQIILNFAIRKADIVLPITQYFGEYLSRRYGSTKMIPLTMGFDEEVINQNITKIDWLDEIKKNNFIIGYLGTLSFLRNPDFMLKVFAGVKNKYSNCKLMLMGEVAEVREKYELIEICGELSIVSDVIFTGNLDKRKLQSHLNYCDLTLSAIPPEWYYSISSPTKIYESLGNGIPVIANLGIYEQEKVIKESNGGILVPYSVKEFVKAVLCLINDREELNKMGKNGQKYVLDNYTYKQIAMKLLPYFVDKV